MHSLKVTRAEASPPVSSQWIRANAGSGKTTVLTNQVLKLLLLGVPPERICCITYTKAAAGEMRLRVIAGLRGLLLMDEQECRLKVESLIGARADATIMARARLLFGQVIDSAAGGIQLTTIHGFCQQLLRAFPLEAGVAPHFSVADDMQEAQLRSLVKHRLLSTRRHDPQVSAALSLLAERSGEARFDSLIKALLDAQMDTIAPPNEIRTRTYALLDLPEDASEETIVTDTLDCLDDRCKETLRAALPRLAKEKAGYKQKLAQRGARWLEGSIEIEAWIDIWLTQKFTPRTDLQKGEFAPGTPFGDMIARCIDSALHCIARRAALALAEESFAAIVLARQLDALYQQAKDERGVLDYDDLITRARELLTLRDMVGWVMTKLDHRIDHLLIDEAQDTSSEQWRIATALVDELVASNGGEGSAGVPRSLFVVGDEKQSIFSFQGAAPELYAGMERQFTQALLHAPTPLRPRSLIHSYRSAPAILTLVDAVARDVAIASALNSLGVPQEHALIRENAVGEVVLHPPIAPPEKAPREPFTIPKEYQITRSAAQLLAEQVADQVSAWINAGTWNAGDILILTRNRKPIVLPLLRALQRKKIPVAGIDRLVLSDHLAVKDLLALMRWCLSEQDDLALAQVLRSPLIGWSDEQLREAAVGRGKISLAQRISGDTAMQLNGWRQLAHATPYDFLTHVLEVNSKRAQFARRFGAEIHEILDELKEQAMALPVGMAPSLSNFAAWIASSDRTIKRELESGDRGQVRVMTVHGAKGLEAKLVLLVDTVSMPSLSKEIMSEAADVQGQVFPLLALSDEAKQSTIWKNARDGQSKAQMEEYYRLLYVALTRAVDALHLFAVEPSRGELKAECWYAVVKRALEALPETATENDGSLRLSDSGKREPNKKIKEEKIVELPRWVSEIPPPSRITPTLSPSGLGAEALAPFAKPRGETVRERGVRLHRVLQFLDASTTREQVARLIAHLAPDWTEQQQTAAAQEIWKLYEAERWLWTNPGSAEVNISGTVDIEGNAYPVLGQIDRLVETPDALVVLDYKTGREVPDSPERVGEGYLFQLKLYGALLETLYPGRRIRPAILWTAKAQLMWLDEAVSKLSWSRARLPQIP